MIATTTERVRALGDGLRPLRPRRPANLRRVGAGAALVVGSALVAGLAVASAGDRAAVLAVRRPVGVGEVLGRADLAVARVAADAHLRPVLAGRLDSVVGRVTAVALAPGALLTESALATGPRVGADEAVVAVPLRVADVPAGLGPGDDVALVAATEDAAMEARVYAMNVRGGTVVVSMVVPRLSADGLARAARDGQVAVVLEGPA